MSTDSFNELVSEEFAQAYQDDALRLWNNCVKECLGSSSFHEAWRAGQQVGTQTIDPTLWKVLDECLNGSKPNHDPVEGLMRLYAVFLSAEAARRFKSKM